MPHSSEPSDPQAWELYELLPLPLIVFHGERVAYANAAFSALQGLSHEEALALTSSGFITRTVSPEDLEWIRGINERRLQGEVRRTSDQWVQLLLGPNRRKRSVRLIGIPGRSAEERIYVLIEEAQETSAKALMDSLTSASTQFFKLRDEDAVLEAAADTLFAQGLVTGFFVRRGDEYLMGPSRHPWTAEAAAHAGVQRSAFPVSMQQFPQVQKVATERVSLFVQNVHEVLSEVYPAQGVGFLKEHIPGRCLMAPILVDGDVFGVLLVLSADLTPSGAAGLDLFARALGGALENVRHHRRAAERLQEVMRLQNQLVQRERLAALGEAAAVIAHEVRNPLGAILNVVSVLGKHQRSAGDREMLDVLREEASRLDHMVTDLLNCARPLEPRPRPLELNQFAEDALAPALERLRPGAPRALEWVPSQGRIDVEADANLLRLALENLVRNARQACTPQGKIRVSVGATPCEALLAVDDDGPGVPEEDVPRLFEPFFTTRPTGTGLGLAVVSRVAKAHGGGVRVSRSALGGARFELHLPKNAPPARAEGASGQ